MNTKKRSHPSRKSEWGQSIVELAMVTPMILLLTAAGLDLANMFYAYHIMTNATREGARFATEAKTDMTDGQVQSVADLRMKNAFPSAGSGGSPIFGWWEHEFSTEFQEVVQGGTRQKFLKVTTTLEPSFFLDGVLRSTGVLDQPLKLEASALGYRCELEDQGGVFQCIQGGTDEDEDD